jgi:hypothetical protein
MMVNTNATVALLDSQDTGLDMLAQMANGAGILALPAHDLHELAVLLSRSGLAHFFSPFLGVSINIQYLHPL